MSLRFNNPFKQMPVNKMNNCLNLTNMYIDFFKLHNLKGQKEEQNRLFT